MPKNQVGLQQQAKQAAKVKLFPQYQPINFMPVPSDRNILYLNNQPAYFFLFLMLNSCS
jgi:hypothetical protein